MMTKIDRAIWTGLKRLEDEGNPGFLLSLLTTFLDSVPVLLLLLGDALQAHDMQKIAKLCHNLKSSCLSIGALQTGAKLEALERAALTSELDLNDARINSALSDLQNVVALIKREQYSLSAQQ